MHPTVVSVHALTGHRLLLRFTTGETKVFDVAPYLDQGVFRRLRVPGVFAGARVVAGSVEWPGGVDLSYDTLYLDGVTVPGDAGERDHSG